LFAIGKVSFYRSLICRNTEKLFRAQCQEVFLYKPASYHHFASNLLAPSEVGYLKTGPTFLSPRIGGANGCKGRPSIPQFYVVW